VIAVPAETLHATCVAIDGDGVLIIGPSGSGKSDLALRLIDRGAALVSDDRCIVAADDSGMVRVSPPATLAGRIEVRGIGIVTMPYVADVVLALVVSLEDDPPRMPDEGDSIAIARCPFPRLRLISGHCSAPVKVALALRVAKAKMA
jgi:serine kinase of HPr protein (carbohydrate metabolism regulator)